MSNDDFPQGDHIAFKKAGTLLCNAGPERCAYCRRIKNWWDAQHYAEKWVVGIRDGVRGVRGVGDV